MSIHLSVAVENLKLALGQTLLHSETRWPSGRASDSGARGRVFDPHPGRCVVSLSKIHLPPKSTGYTT